MATRVGGNRRKTRHVFKNSIREKGKISIRRVLAEYKEGEQVVLKAQPGIQKGIYFRRFHGKSGIVSGKQGACFKVDIKDKTADKTIIVHPAHLKRQV